MITKRKKPLSTVVTAPAKGATIRDRRPAGAPSRGQSTRRRTSLRREQRRGRGLAPRASIGILETAFHAGLAFFGAAMAVSCVVSLIGNVMLESVRRGTIEAQGQLRAETAGREDLKGKLAALTSSDAVDRWATEHGYQSTEEIAPTIEANEGRSLVASR